MNRKLEKMKAQAADEALALLGEHSREADAKLAVAAYKTIYRAEGGNPDEPGRYAQCIVNPERGYAGRYEVHNISGMSIKRAPCYTGELWPALRLAQECWPDMQVQLFWYPKRKLKWCRAVCELTLAGKQVVGEGDIPARAVCRAICGMLLWQAGPADV